ncbi:PREDICTED: vegetative cell wall gp1 [Prunus dulcis]|uniref:PREDICTED: vegetative cell wall gp1 n=1 Tax=Prunus dulcis TaxID=3755 RepID=A0A5E4G125_PRUDU|nr:PREDICTED: vegetative cell wall gp1 [Prunus dulcis]
MSSSISSFSSTLIRRTIPFCSFTNSTTSATSTQFLSPKRKPICPLLARALPDSPDQYPTRSPPEFSPPVPGRYDQPSAPPEVPGISTSPDVDTTPVPPPEVNPYPPPLDPDPNPGQDFPVPPLKPPPVPDIPPPFPDNPLPKPDVVPPQPPDIVPPPPPGPEIIQPPAPPRPPTGPGKSLATTQMFGQSKLTFSKFLV